MHSGTLSMTGCENIFSNVSVNVWNNVHYTDKTCEIWKYSTIWLPYSMFQSPALPNSNLRGISPAHTHICTCTPGQPEPFTGSRGEEQVLTDSNTCYWKVCSPSVILGFTGLGGYCSVPVLTAKVFLDSRSTYKKNKKTMANSCKLVAYRKNSFTISTHFPALNIVCY